MPIKEVHDVLAVLDKAIRSREAKTGFKVLDESGAELAGLAGNAPHAAETLLCLAQWVDLGYTKAELFERLYESCKQIDRSTVPTIDFLRLNLADAFRTAHRQDQGTALRHLEIVHHAGEGILCEPLQFVTAYWMGRWFRRKGEYEKAFGHIKAAQQIAASMEAPRLVAVTKIDESWLVFQKGERAAAFNLLNEAEMELLPTEHFLSLGNIESARGRFVRRSGDYARALCHFEKAIGLFGSILPEHANLARALVNAAYVKRLIALDMRTYPTTKPIKGRQHELHLRIVREALAMLDRARAIYSSQHHQGGTGSVLVNAGHLHLDVGDIARAGEEALTAYNVGQEQNDIILMARARTLQSAVALELAEEELEDEGDPARHSRLAIERATDAITLAQTTQNRRLLAEAYLARANAATQSQVQEWDVAKEYLTKASDLLTPDDKDHLLQELHLLRRKILSATTVDERLRRWSSGELNGETFQQIEEEFAEIVIPKVWHKYGRSVTRVAEALSISPKKVRRILRNTRAHNSAD